MQPRNLCCFFDYRKAFDSVPHLPLLEKLECLGLNVYTRHWVTDYLTNRSQRVVVNSESSLPTPVISGVPQGSGGCTLVIWTAVIIELVGLPSLECRRLHGNQALPFIQDHL